MSYKNVIAAGAPRQYEAETKPLDAMCTKYARIFSFVALSGATRNVASHGFHLLERVFADGFKQAVARPSASQRFCHDERFVQQRR